MSTCNVGSLTAGAPGNDAAADRGRADDTENAILDAAAECVLAFGMRRASLSDVARRAGVSRPTVYRRWPDRRALVADLMTRELAAVFAAAAGHGPDRPGSVRAQAVRQFLAAAAALRAHPLLTKIIQVDPELLQPYIFERLGTSQRMGLGFIAERIRAGQQDGSVRPGDVTAMSATVLFSIQSLVLSGRTTAGLLSPGQLDAEAAVLLDRYLSPAAGSAAAAPDQAGLAAGSAGAAGPAAGSGGAGGSQGGAA
jgi:AcrR family transcriptional regulator